MSQDSIRKRRLGSFPSKWRIYSIEDLSASNKRAIKIGPFGSQLKKTELVEKGLKIYGQENVKEENFEIGKRYISKEKFNDLKNFEIFPKDVLVTMMGSIGSSTVVPDEISRGIMDSHLLRIQVDNDKIYPNFLAMLIKDSFLINNQILSLSHGSIMSGLNSKIVRSLLIPTPPLVEQCGIVEVLGTVDECIRLTDVVIERAEELKRGLMQRLLTRGIGHTEYKETPLGTIPKKWNVVPLRKITSKIKDMDHKMPDKTEKGVPFISVTYLLKTRSPYFTINYDDKDVEYISEDDYSYHKDKFNVEYNDLLYSRFGTIGYARLINTKKELLASYSIVMIKPIRTIVEPLFLVYSLNDWDAFKQAKMMTKGSTNKNLHLEDIRDIQIKLPPINEQQKIMKILLDSDKKIALEENKREN